MGYMVVVLCSCVFSNDDVSEFLMVRKGLRCRENEFMFTLWMRR